MSRIDASSAPGKSVPVASSLYASRNTLHLLYHRNKNQHRNTKWFKWLGVLKRWVNRLIFEIENAEAESLVSLDWIDEKSKPIMNLIVYLNQHIVPKCYRAFSSVVADKQFSAMGMALLAILSELASLIRIPECENIITATSTQLEVGDSVPATADGPSAPRLVSDGEDHGEVVHRYEVQTIAVEQDNTERVSEELPVSTAPLKSRKQPRYERYEIDLNNGPSAEAAEDQEIDMSNSRTKPQEKEKKKKKKKRKGNAIDDIFGDLG